MNDGEQPSEQAGARPRSPWFRKASLIAISISALILLVCVQESLAHLLVPADIEAEAPPRIVDAIPPADPQPSVQTNSAEAESAERAPPAHTGTIDPFEDENPFVETAEEETAEPDRAGYVRMPDFRRLRYREARLEARNLGLQIRRRGEIPTVHTRVRRQSIEAGALVAPGTEVSVHLRTPDALIGFGFISGY